MSFCQHTFPLHPIYQILHPQARATESNILSRKISEWEANLSFPQIYRHRAELFRREIGGFYREEINAKVLPLGYRLTGSGVPQLRSKSGNTAQRAPAEGFHLIFAAGLFDALSSGRAVILLRHLWNMVFPSGRLIVTSIAPEIPDAAYLEALWSYWPEYRCERQMATLARSLPEEQVDSQCIFRDDSGRSLFLELQKSAS